MSKKKPKVEDYIAPPISNEERIDALNRLIEREVRAARQVRFDTDMAEWKYNNEDSR
jgi:hypothetical protein